MKKVSVLALIIVLLVTLSVTVAYAYQSSILPEDSISENTDISTTPAYKLGDTNSRTLTGKNGAVLLVDSISDTEYSEMMSVLYPKGLVDDQGLEIAGIDNMEEARAKYIEEHTKAYFLNGTEVSEVSIVPFSVKLESVMNGIYDSPFYKASIGKDTFVFPSEWGNQSCGFSTVSEAGVYLAYTDLGIWLIEPDSLNVKKISSDTYSEMNRSDMIDTLKHLNQDWYLSWIDGVQISPDGLYAVYRTNRDCLALSETSVWAINLETGEESQIVAPAINNDIVGFLSAAHIVVGALADTRIAEINTKNLVSVFFPPMPNFILKGVCNGITVYSSYADGSSDTAAHVSNIDVETGKLSPITSVAGYLGGEAFFSPSCRKMAIGYGTDPMLGVVDIMIVDLSDGSQELLHTSSIDTRQKGTGFVTQFQWVSDDITLVSYQDGGATSDYVVQVN